MLGTSSELTAFSLPQLVQQWGKVGQQIVSDPLLITPIPFLLGFCYPPLILRILSSIGMQGHFRGHLGEAL